MHEACLDLLSEQCPLMKLRQPEAVQALFELCRSLPDIFEALDWGYRFDPNARETNSSITHNWHWAFSEPTVDLTLKRILRNRSQQGRHKDGNSLQDAPTNFGDNCDGGRLKDLPEHKDIFKHLPVDIITDIQILLASKDVASFRETSRAVYNAGLPVIFWRSRFQPGGELAHIFEASHIPSLEGFEGGWPQLYIDLQQIQRLDTMGNRKRIWILASGLADLILAKLLSQPVEMTPMKSKPYTQRRSGAVSLYYIEKPVISNGAGPWTAIVSQVRIAGQNYVAGFGLCRGGGNGMPTIDFGYHRPGNESTWTAPEYVPDHDSTSWKIQTCSDYVGVRGIRFMCKMVQRLLGSATTISLRDLSPRG